MRANFILTTDTGRIHFNQECSYWLDVDVFEKKAYARKLPVSTIRESKASHFEEAINLYRGDLLEDIYADWALREQERLRMIYIDILKHLLHYHWRCGKLRKSIDHGRKILNMDPLRKEIYRALMRLYVENQQRNMALLQYKECYDVLNAELGIAPMEETQRLYRQIVATVPIVHDVSHADRLEQSLRHLGSAFEELRNVRTQIRQILKEAS